MEGLTGYNPGLDAGDAGGADVLGLRRLMGLFHHVPHLDVPVLCPNEEHSRSGQRPASYGASLQSAGHFHDGSKLKQKSASLWMHETIGPRICLTTSEHQR